MIENLSALALVPRAGVCLCTQGWAEVLLNDRPYRLTKGKAFIVSPLIQHRYVERSEDYGEILVDDTLEVFYPVFRLISNTSYPLRVRENPCLSLTEETQQFIHTQMHRIQEKHVSMNDAQSQTVQMLLARQIHLIKQETLLVVITEICRNLPTIDHEVSVHDMVVYRFLLSVHAHYAKERSVAYYASEVNLSTGHFSTIIKESTGKLPSAWIATITITYAKHLLARTDMSIKEIASRLNFPEQFTFRKYFKHHTSLSPTEYRETENGNLKSASK